VTSAARDWYLSRTQREQRLILLMLAIALPVLAWLLVVLPLDAAYDDAAKDHLEAVSRHGRVLALADVAKSASARRTRESNTDLQLVVTESASRAGIVLQGTSPGGPNVIDLTVAGGRAPALAQWLAQFEAQGILVHRMNMTPLPDGTVNLSARLARGG
jgi:general secretion pathway protein M